MMCGSKESLLNSTSWRDFAVVLRLSLPSQSASQYQVTFILNNSTLGFGLPMNISTGAGVLFALTAAGYVIKTSKGKGETDLADEEQPKVETKTA